MTNPTDRWRRRPVAGRHVKSSRRGKRTPCAEALDAIVLASKIMGALMVGLQGGKFGVDVGFTVDVLLGGFLGGVAGAFVGGLLGWWLGRLIGQGIGLLIISIFAFIDRPKTDSLVVVGLLTKLAAVIAGPRRTKRGEEWEADLAAETRAGQPLTTQAKREHAFGVLIAAIRMRRSDVARALGRSLDWMLAEPRGDQLTFLVTLSSGGYFLNAGGLDCLMNNLDNVAAGGIITGIAVLALRKLRGVQPRRGRHDQPGNK